MVIGPIVLCGNSRGPASAASPCCHSAAVTVNAPPVPRERAVIEKPLHAFVMEEQQNLKWCWAAVAVSVNKFLNPGSTMTQSRLATPVLLKETQIGANIQCDLTPGACEFPASLDDALRESGNLRPGGDLQDQHLTFASIAAWIDVQLPIAGRIQWFGGGAHFLVLDGYRTFDSDEPLVHVQDPFYGTSFQCYSTLVEDYPPGGCWEDTYLLQQDGN
jgi:hypothetical protein